MEFAVDGAPTIYLHVPTEATFEKLIDLKELPEAVLEIAEVRDIHDLYLDTADTALLRRGMDLRASTVGTHHFLIFNEVKSGKLLAVATEHVEKLSSDEHAKILAGDRSHSLFSKVATIQPITALVPALYRKAVFQSRLFKIGETRFELGLEAIAYERNGTQKIEQLVSLDLIQGHQEILEAIAQYLVDEFELERIHGSPFARGVQLIG